MTLVHCSHPKGIAFRVSRVSGVVLVVDILLLDYFILFVIFLFLFVCIYTVIRVLHYFRSWI
jgi:hypothetical protein